MSGIAIARIVLAALAVVLLTMAIRIVPEYERLVVFRLGRLRGKRCPGIVLIVPLVEPMRRSTSRSRPPTSRRRTSSRRTT